MDFIRFMKLIYFEHQNISFTWEWEGHVQHPLASFTGSSKDDVTLAGASDAAECKRVRLQSHKQEALKRYLLL